MDKTKKKGPRIIGALILVLIILFFGIELLIREGQHFSPTSVTNILLFSLHVIVFLLFLILLFVLGRNLIKLYLERKQKVVGAHLKSKLLLFFIALSFTPTLLLFLFASDLISRNIENLFRTPIEQILEDTKKLSEGYYVNAEDITLHYAKRLSLDIVKKGLTDFDKKGLLNDFLLEKLKEYQLDEIGIFLGDEELYSILNSNLPLQYYQEVKKNRIKRAHLGEKYGTIASMGNGELVRCGISTKLPDESDMLVVTGKFLPQNYSQRINNINAYVQLYRQQKFQKNPVRTLYLITLIFVTLLIIFTASWIGFRLAKSIIAPIEKLAQATKEVSKGNLTVRVEDPASDELGMLIESFNQMISDLQESHRNIAQKTSELKAHSHYIETILNNVTTGVITVDAEGAITTINPSARAMIGFQDDVLIHKGYEDVFSRPEFRKIKKSIKNGLQDKFNPPNEAIDLNIYDRKSSISLTLSPLSRNKKKYSGMILVLDDLTQLIKAQRIAAWKEIAQQVAHEIKNPLTPIQLSAERIIKNLREKGGKDHRVISESAETIVQEARAIKSLVDEFSNFARLPIIRLQPVDIHEVIKGTVSLFKDIFAEITFETRLSSKVPSAIQVDPEKMKRVFINILDNAIDAMDKKGKIKIHSSFDDLNQMVKIEIRDTGPGISMEDKEKLFLPHFSTKKKGTGLGLAIVHQIISEHNGTIVVENIKPHGAKFIIQVPT